MSIWLTPALWAALASAPAPETFEYRIEKGDTCEGIARERYGGPEHVDVIHRANPWLGAQLPHHLEPGQTLVLPKTLPPAPPDAEVTAAQRKVEARSADAPDWQSAQPGLDLYRGWRVNTRESASAEITFRDATSIELRENTLVIIYGGFGGSRTKARRETAQATLDRGALRSRLGAYTGKADRAVTVTTPSAVAEFAGGNSLVTVDDGGTSRVANHGEGKAAVRSSGKGGPTVRVKPKMGSKVDQGKAPTKPKPLPPTPSWIERGATKFVAAGERGGTIQGEWGAIAGAAAYRVEVSQDPEGRELLVSQTVPASIQRFEAQGLPAGDYYASVAAMDDDAFESPPSARRKLGVVPVYLITPGAAPLSEGDAGAAAEDSAAGVSGPTRVLRGTRLDVPRDLRCSVDDGEPSRVPVLGEAGEHTIACVAADGQLVPGFTVMVVDVKVAASAKAHAAVRGQTTVAAFSIDAEVPLPRRLWVEAPDGFLVGEPTAAAVAGQWQVRVHADAGAPAEASLQVMADAGGEAVELGQVALEVEDPPAAATAPAVTPSEPRGPERHMFEGGVYGGVMLPSPRHNLFQVRYALIDEWQPLRPAAGAFGLRLGYYPVRWVGVELENGLTPTRTRETGDRVNLFTVRGHVLGQLPWRITPTVHAGAGVLGITTTSVLGGEIDAAVYFGAGAKLYATRWAVVRLDVRDVITEGRGGTVAHSPEILLGIGGVLGRRSAAAPPRSPRGGERPRKAATSPRGSR
jgi:hypothetical protein